MINYGLAGCLLGTWLVVAGSPAWGADYRMVFKASRSERTLMLSQMRKMQESIQGILHGLEANDMAGVAESAATSGPSMMQALPMTLRKRFPKEFQELGMNLHKGFMGIAKAAKSGANKGKIISLLGENYGNCIACHATYRFK